MSKYILYISIFLYSVSLLLPSIIYTPTYVDVDGVKTCQEARGVISSSEHVKCNERLHCEKISEEEAAISSESAFFSDNNFRLTAEDVEARCLQVNFSQESNIHSGYNILLLGWITVFSGLLAWLANPIYFVSIILINTKKYLLGLILSITGFLFALTSVLYTGLGNSEMFRDERYRLIESFDYGFFVWLLSLALLVIYAYIRHQTAVKLEEHIVANVD